MKTFPDIYHNVQVVYMFIWLCSYIVCIYLTKYFQSSILKSHHAVTEKLKMSCVGIQL